MNTRHHFWMIIGCILPLLLIFFLPVFGISGNLSILIFIVLMFGCHFLMMGRHGSHKEGDKTNQNKKEDSYASHQH